MQILQSPAKLIGLSIGEQDIEVNCEWRLLYFCLIVNYEDKIVLWNALTKEMIALSKEETAFLKTERIYITNDLLRTLAKKWFLVPIDFLDFKLSQQITNLARSLSVNNDIIEYTILPTTACNARCFYCFESGVLPISMDETIAHKVAKFIIEHASKQQISLRWFGGEPLCNVKAIDIITTDLLGAGIAYRSSMVTNGYLFNDENVNKAKNNWNLKRIQITLDGTKEKYNQIKNYVYAQGNPFEIVMSNISRLLDSEMNISIRLNMDSHNCKDLFELVEYLHLRFNGYDNLSIYPHLLFEKTGTNKEFRTTSERDSLVSDLLKLEERIEKYGMQPRTRKLNKEIKRYACMADNPQSIMILPNGKFNRCEHINATSASGYPFEDNKNRIWHDYIGVSEKCKRCSCYPECLILEGCKNQPEECYDYERKRKEKQIIKSIYRTCDEFYYNNKKTTIME